MYFARPCSGVGKAHKLPMTQQIPIKKLVFPSKCLNRKFSNTQQRLYCTNKQNYLIKGHSLEREPKWLSATEKEKWLTYIQDPRTQFDFFPADTFSNFADIRQSRCFFKDSSEAIKTLADRKGFRTAMLLRPRRFGKSLFESMLADFYDVKQNDNFDFLFKGLKIYNHAHELPHNQFMILKLNFSFVNRSADLATMEADLHSVVNSAVRDFYADYEMYVGQEIIFQNSKETLMKLFHKVKQGSIPVMLLIDEYDAITNEYLDSEDYKTLRDKQSLLKALYALFKANIGNNCINFMVLVGVAPLSLNDHTSGFNVEQNITFDKEFETVLGLTQDDVQKGLSTVLSRRGFTGDNLEAQIKNHLELLTSNVNGYRFSETAQETVYTTNFVLEYLNNLLLGKPLTMSANRYELSSAVLSFFSRSYSSYKLLSELATKRTTALTLVHRNFRMQDLEQVGVHADPSYLKSLLLHFGGLTFGKEGSNLLVVPNQLAQIAVVDKAIKTFRLNLESDEYWKSLSELLFNNNAGPMCDYVQRTTFELNTKEENFDHHNEFTTQVAFVASLHAPDLYTIEMEKPVHGEARTYKFVKNWYDAVAFEKQTKDSTEKRKCVLFEFKNKNLKYLAINGNSATERAQNLRKMDKSKVSTLKVASTDKFEPNKSMEAIMLEAKSKQLDQYARQLLEEPGREVIGHVILSVGSSHILHTSARYIKQDGSVLSEDL